MKWGKEKFEGLELSTEEPPLVFKGQLFALTNVPPDRQKLMLGGTTIGDQDWGKAQPKIKDVRGAALFQGKGWGHSPPGEGAESFSSRGRGGVILLQGRGGVILLQGCVWVIF